MPVDRARSAVFAAMLAWEGEAPLQALRQPARFWQYRVRFARSHSVYGPVLRSVRLDVGP